MTLTTNSEVEDTGPLIGWNGCGKPTLIQQKIDSSDESAAGLDASRQERTMLMRELEATRERMQDDGM
jgi:hypothetical protein